MQLSGSSGLVSSRVLTQVLFVVNISPNIYTTRKMFEILWGVVISIWYCLNRKFTKYKQANKQFEILKYTTSRTVWRLQGRDATVCYGHIRKHVPSFHYNKNLSGSRNMETCLTLAGLCFTVSSPSSIPVTPNCSIRHPWNSSFHFIFLI
jgi:hypothetical protein